MSTRRRDQTKPGMRARSGFWGTFQTFRAFKRVKRLFGPTYFHEQQFSQSVKLCSLERERGTSMHQTSFVVMIGHCMFGDQALMLVILVGVHVTMAVRLVNHRFLRSLTESIDAMCLMCDVVRSQCQTIRAECKYQRKGKACSEMSQNIHAP
ncbi:hypothetical protein AAFO92_10230 [Roseovarius sp. CAU 1744]|uniref:hypothetical protein n=1 Tax=Roseovarius sp. CAU 1744 TaxID=3140368 RepID=UPI00325B6638